MIQQTNNYSIHPIIYLVFHLFHHFFIVYLIYRKINLHFIYVIPIRIIQQDYSIHMLGDNSNDNFIKIMINIILYCSNLFYLNNLTILQQQYQQM